MSHQMIGRWVHSAITVAALLGAQLAIANPVVSTNLTTGDTIKLRSNATVGTGGGGAFQGVVLSGVDKDSTFESFCLEFAEHISYGTTYYVGGVTDHTVNQSGTYAAYSGPEVGHTSTQDPISWQTAWLFTQFYNTHLSDTVWGAGTQVEKNTALQQAIWYFEGEDIVGSPSLNNLAKNYHDLAIEATTLGQDQLITWSGIGNVRVLNLFGDASFTQHAQDQLYMIPEPASYSLMLGALGLMGLLARRRKTSAV